MLTRNEKIAAAIIIILTIIVSLYLIVTAYQEVGNRNKLYSNIKLFYKKPDYRIRHRLIDFRNHYPQHRNMDLKLRSIFESFNGLSIFYNGTINESADINLDFIKHFKINDTKRILQRINEFLPSLGFYTNYSYVIIRLLEIKLETPSTTRIIDYTILCRIVYHKKNAGDDDYPIFQLSMSARTGAITRLELCLNKDSAEKHGLLEDWSKLSMFADINKINSSEGLHELLYFMGFSEEYYPLEEVIFKVRSVEKHGSEEIIRYAGYIHGIQVPYVSISIRYEQYKSIKNIRIYTYILPLKIFRIEYYEPSISKDSVLNIAMKYIREDMNVPEDILEVYKTDQTYYFRDENTLMNYYAVYAKIYIHANCYELVLYIDPIKGEIHDYSVTLLW